MRNFDKAVERVFEHEGGYANHPNDPGGETMWGITKRVARNWGYRGAMINLPKDTARKIYEDLYWHPGFDKMEYEVAFQAFDGAINSGLRQSIRWLQRAADVADDGILGPITLGAVNADRSASVVLRYLHHRLMFMTKLSTWRSFGKGWARRIAKNMALAAEHMGELG